MQMSVVLANSPYVVATPTCEMQSKS